MGGHVSALSFCLRLEAVIFTKESVCCRHFPEVTALTSDPMYMYFYELSFCANAGDDLVACNCSHINYICRIEIIHFL
jgi:hypothetical protein